MEQQIQATENSLRQINVIQNMFIDRRNRRKRDYNLQTDEIASKKVRSIHDIPETSSSNYTGTEQETEGTSPFEVDLVKFDEAYLELDPNRMWTLRSGSKVEEVIYKFARNLPGETCLHSFIINDAKSLFFDDEWKEITASEVKDNSKLERSLRELMKKYTVKSVKELRKIVYEQFIPDGNEYDQSLHNNLDFINHAYRSMLFLWQKEENPFDSLKLEGWYEMNVWSHLIDLAFHDINIDLVRGEGMSNASSDRKNLTRTINYRKKIGRKGDGVFRLCSDRLEFGAIEAGRKWEGQSGTKYSNDSLKLFKMLEEHDCTTRYYM
ncbi:3318_t:CDS:2 [Acaulospora colombiana]|uniref:3318_t:CDS:1 n=1 Tax=Acaulospora colombiana TaxID=27376 RepID=A0ACA9LV01_9GLOM|nr:3318_t:CDS:2 [Acaulospora colombiana]